jgi:ribosomal protein S12 methylthiotransferase accessory factor
VRAFVLPSDLPASTVMAISFDPGEQRPAQVVGLGCHPDPAIALTKALFELCQGRPAEGHRFRENPPRGRLDRYEDVKTLDDHSAFLTLPERRGEFEFLWAGGTRVRVGGLPNPSVGDTAADLDRCARELSAGGYRVAYADLTLPDVASCGYHVVRAIVTGLQPIHFGYGLERFGGQRLFELPQKLGFAAEARTEDSLNPCPHPLA